MNNMDSKTKTIVGLVVLAILATILGIVIGFMIGSVIYPTQVIG